MQLRKVENKSIKNFQDTGKSFDQMPLTMNHLSVFETIALLAQDDDLDRALELLLKHKQTYEIKNLSGRLKMLNRSIGQGICTNEYISRERNSIRLVILSHCTSSVNGSHPVEYTEDMTAAEDNAVATEVATMSMEIKLNWDFDTFSQEDQEALFNAIKVFLKKKGDIKITQKRRGSVIFRLEMSPEECEALHWAIKRGEFEELGVEDSVILEDELKKEEINLLPLRPQIESQLHEFLRTDNIEKAIGFLILNMGGGDVDLMFIAGRYSQLKIEQLSGVLSHEDFTSERNQIRNALFGYFRKPKEPINDKDAADNSNTRVDIFSLGAGFVKLIDSPGGNDKPKEKEPTKGVPAPKRRSIPEPEPVSGPIRIFDISDIEHWIKNERKTLLKDPALNNLLEVASKMLLPGKSKYPVEVRKAVGVWICLDQAGVRALDGARESALTLARDLDSNNAFASALALAGARSSYIYGTIIPSNRDHNNFIHRELANRLNLNLDNIHSIDAGPLIILFLEGNQLVAEFLKSTPDLPNDQRAWILNEMFEPLGERDEVGE